MRFDTLRSDAIKSIKQRWLLRYWSELRGKRAVPFWESLTLAEIATVSDTVNFLDVVGNGEAPRFQITFHGETIGRAHGGSDCRGKFLDEIVPPAQWYIAGPTYRHAVATGRPVYTASDMYDRHSRPVYYERLLLPFTTDGRRVDRIVGSLEQISPVGDFEQRRIMTEAAKQPVLRVCGTIDVGAPAAPAAVETLES